MQNITHIDRVRCDECGDKHYEEDTRGEYDLIYKTGLCTTCTDQD